MTAYEWALNMKDGVSATMAKLSAGADKTSAQFSHLQNKISGIGSSARSAVAGLAMLAISALGVYSAADFIKGSIEAANHHEQAQAQIRQALMTTHGVAGMTEDQLAAQRAALGSTTLFKQGDMMEAQESLLKFEHVRGKIFSQAMTDAGDLATRLHTSLPEAAELMGRALENPAAAMRVLRQAGIIMTREQVKHIADLTAAGKQYEVQQTILNMLMERFGGAAKTAAETGLGPIQMMMKKWDEFKIKVGAMIVEWIKQHKPQIELFFHVLESGIMFIIDHATGLTSVVVGLMAMYTAFELLTGVATLFNLTLAASPLGLIVTAVGLLSAGIFECYNKFEGFRDVVKETFTALKDGLTLIWGLVDAMEVLSPIMSMNVGAHAHKKIIQPTTHGDISSGISAAFGLKKPDAKGTENTLNNIDKISGGGNKNVTVNIGALVKDGVNIHSTTLKEGAAEMKAIIEEYLIRAIRGGEIAISNS